jgi:muconate cycloisomerase
VELAWQDACARSAHRPLGGPISPAVRVTGVLGSADPARTARQLWLMRLIGLRDFKLKLGLGEQIDRENISVVHSRLAKALGGGKCTLRVDVNSGWELQEAAQRIEHLAQLGICAVEQPVSAPAGRLAGLAQRCPLPLIADESLITSADFNELVRAGKGRVWLNIRIAKNGGLDSALAMARAAAAAGVPFIIGCMVGETAILSAAQRALLGRCPPPRFVEGNYGRLLLSDDIARKSPRFGYAGRLKALPGPGLGVVVDPKRLAKYGKLIKTLRD